MTAGETNRLEIRLGPVAGANSIEAVTFSNSGLSFTTDGIDGTIASVFVSGGDAGKDYVVTVTATLSSNETKVGAILLEWKSPGYGNLTGVE